MEKAMGDSRTLIFMMAAVFIIIVAMLYLNTLKGPSLVDLYFQNISESVGNATFNPEAINQLSSGGGGLPDSQGAQQAGGLAQSGIGGGGSWGTCTPLGDARELLQLTTKYMLYYDTEPTYVDFTPISLSPSFVQFRSVVKSSYMGQVITAESYYTYDWNGNCLQLQIVPGEFAGSVPQGDTIMECTGFPLWFACAEYIDVGAFAGSEPVTIGGRRHMVRKYKSGNMEAWIGPEEYPILFMYSITDSNTNKSFSAELIGVEGGGILR